MPSVDNRKSVKLVQAGDVHGVIKIKLVRMPLLLELVLSPTLALAQTLGFLLHLSLVACSW